MTAVVVIVACAVAIVGLFIAVEYDADTFRDEDK